MDGGHLKGGAIVFERQKRELFARPIAHAETFLCSIANYDQNDRSTDAPPFSPPQLQLIGNNVRLRSIDCRYTILPISWSILTESRSILTKSRSILTKSRSILTKCRSILTSLLVESYTYTVNIDQLILYLHMSPHQQHNNIYTAKIIIIIFPPEYYVKEGRLRYSFSSRRLSGHLLLLPETIQRVVSRFSGGYFSVFYLAISDFTILLKESC
jgi:hypothetical protein